ncbi:OPT oligopeptide transporter protein-domain-containing protein, partial [Chytriomyces sp. MP71]
MENVVSQAMPTLMGNKNITLFAALSFVFVTQFTGYGFAGLCRRFLVKPSAMIWPGIVGPMAILIAFHSKTDSEVKQLSEPVSPPTDGAGAIEMSPFLPSPHIGSSALSASSVTSTPDPTSQPSALTISEAMGLRDDATPDKVPMPSDQSIPKQHTTSKRAVFWYSALGIFLYTHIPEYLLPGLQTISICSPGSYAGLPSGHMGKYNNVASTTTGIGLFGLTFDWYYISKSAPVNTPYWALVGSNIGNILISWIIVVCLFEADAWGASKISDDGINPILNSVHLYAGNPNSHSHVAGS